MKFMPYLFTIFFFFLVGIFIVKNSSVKPAIKPMIEKSATRDPAAIKKVYDFSHLAGMELEHATKQRLISGAKITEDHYDVGIELGHFVVKSPAGEKTFACQVYSNIILVFEGDGSAIAGKKPTMEVHGKCEIARDINLISPLWIPVSRILGEPVADGDFDFHEGRPAKIHFSNVIDEWPSVWKLTQVRMGYASNPNMEVTIEENELKQLSPKPIFVQFRK